MQVPFSSTKTPTTLQVANFVINQDKGSTNSESEFNYFQINIPMLRRDLATQTWAPERHLSLQGNTVFSYYISAIQMSKYSGLTFGMNFMFLY